VLSKQRRSANVLLLMLLGLVYVSILFFLINEALIYSSDGNASLGAFVEASTWLAKNLSKNETALVPMPSVFYVLAPELRNNLMPFKSLWDSVDVIYRANTTIDEVTRVRMYLINLLKTDSRIKYIARDWVDPYSTSIFNLDSYDELMCILRETAVFSFNLSTNWSNKITIYERVQYTTLFAMDLSSPPKNFHTLPPDVLVQYDSDGATIHKANPRVGFYLPLEEGIDSSKQNYLTMQFKLDVKDLDVTLVSYYDINRDGRWSGYEIDYIKSVTFNQTKLGWTTGEWYTIYQVIPTADDPVVQIGIIMEGDSDGTITLSESVVYTEVTP